ncbi:MAG: 50S ribosomal protein L30 [Candidatus Verstraetearchaeota archaeon]|nr:50S ribosomal protein L30 [Candidatus Verstraetearchaeota archaeon]
MKTYLVIRLRGETGIAPEILDALERMNLPSKFSATLISDTPSNMGMINKVADYITWGEIDQQSLAMLLKKRGRLPGEKRLTEEAIKELSLGSYEDLAERMLKEGRVLPPLKKTFRLTPPSGGFKGHITRHLKSGGELGYRGQAIVALLQKMI